MTAISIIISKLIPKKSMREAAIEWYSWHQSMLWSAGLSAFQDRKTTSGMKSPLFVTDI